MDGRLLDQLSKASVQKGYEPETEVDWSRDIQNSSRVLPDWALSVGELPEAGKLPEAVRNRLARNEAASVFSVCIRFEETLIRNLGKYVQRADPEEPGLSYLLHVMEEEARHNRMFIRLIAKLGVGGYPARGVLGVLQHWILALVRSSSPVFYLGVLSVEEITDRIFAEWIEDPETDAVVRDVCRVHRLEEARHRRFSLAALDDAYRRAGRVQKLYAGLIAPVLVNAIFDVLVPPSVYARAGVSPGGVASWRLWLRARQSPTRLAARRRGARSVVIALRDLGAIPRLAAPIWSLLGIPAGESEPR